jgi:hypothetical protein
LALFPAGHGTAPLQGRAQAVSQFGIIIIIIIIVIVVVTPCL